MPQRAAAPLLLPPTPPAQASSCALKRMHKHPPMRTSHRLCSRPNNSIRTFKTQGHIYLLSSLMW